MIKNIKKNKYQNPIEYKHSFSSMKEFAEVLNLKDLAIRSMCSYYRQVRLLSEYHKGKNPKFFAQKQVRDYILYCKLEKGWDTPTLRQAISSIRMFYNDMLGKNWDLWDIVSTKDAQRLPTVLDPEEVTAIFSKITHLRYKIPLELIYSCGLRLSECLSLTPDNIESRNNRIKVVFGKGNKERYVPLSKVMLQRLSFYYKQHKNPHWLFPSVGCGPDSTVRKRMHEATEPMRIGRLQNVLRDAKNAAGIKKKASPHVLRHSYATHLLALGVNIRQLQIYMGHESIDTTTIYTHLIPFSDKNVIDKVDQLYKFTQ
jgi:site-specific recombinase XerD